MMFPCRFKKIMFLILMAAIIMMLSACSKKEEEITKIRDLEFTVVADENIPDELYADLEIKKVQPFKMTYSDGGYTYLCTGYGQQESGGYSIRVNELYLAENAVYFDTTLIGPSAEEAKLALPSYPYIVIRTEYIESPVIFE